MKLGFPWKMKIAKVLGVPVYLHFSTILWWVLIGLLSLKVLALLLCLFVGIVLHEMGHGVVARSCGAKLVDITLYPIGGALGITDLRQGWERIAIAVSGPLMSVGLGVALLVPSGLGWTELDDFTEQLAFANFVIAAFNMLPFMPLDGGNVLFGALDVAVIHKLRKRMARLQPLVTVQVLNIYLTEATIRAVRVSYLILGIVGLLGAAGFIGYGLWNPNPILIVIGLFVLTQAFERLSLIPHVKAPAQLPNPSSES